MGVECVKAVERRGQVHHQLKPDGMVNDIKNSKDVVTFYIKINNLRLLDFSQTFQNIKIQVKGDFSTQISQKQFQKQDKVWISRGQYTAELRTPISQIYNKIVSITIFDRQGKVIDQLKMKLYHLSIGPVKHDHLLKSLKSRLLFDFQVDQYMSVEVLLNDFEILWKNPQKYSGYSYFLSLIFSNTKNHIQATKKYEKHQKIKGWGLQKIQIKNSQLSESIIKLKMANTGNGQDNIECFIPYSKFLQQTSYRQISNEVGSFEKRQLTLNQEIFISGESVGSIRLLLGLTKSKLYAQQMDCVIYSQNGIVMTTATDFQQKSKQLNGSMIHSFLLKLRKGKAQGISDHQLIFLMDEIYLALQDKQLDISDDDDLFKTQQNLLDLVLQLSDFIEEDRVLRNQFIWKILHQILHKKVMNLRYFGSIRDESSKKRYAHKFYQILIGNVIKIINFIDHGISFKQVNYIQRFIAFVYFRLSWCHTQIVQALSRPDDPVISEQKLCEIGVSYAMKSPSKSYFYDYDTNMLKLIQKDDQFIKLMSTLQRTHNQHPNWANLLFDRDYEQLFYGLYSELWDEASFFLNNNGRVMWEYFPRYGVLLSIFLGEMNSNGIIDFSSEMTRCNMKLIKNQKLLNTFMMLIFPKTCLYQTYCVLKCLDLINCYFTVILSNNKTIPNDFNYNYFYTGIRCILESNHSYLLQRMLAMIYKYYNIFSKDFRDTLNHYINCKVFNQLFMHWSQNVRNIFHLLLIFRISKCQNENPQSGQTITQIQNMDQKQKLQATIQNLYNLRAYNLGPKYYKSSQKLSYFQRMKQKLKSRKRVAQYYQTNKDYSIQGSEMSNSYKTTQFSTPVFVRRKWSLAVSFEVQRPDPSEQQLKYLTLSLKEFELAKSEKNSDLIVQARSKILQVNIDQ